jgi:Zn-dependent peptidase ImmA (M78 family)
MNLSKLKVGQSIVVASLPASLESIEIVIAPKQSGTEHAHANHTQIILYPLFFKESKDMQRFILGHELGHWFFNNSHADVKKQIITNERNTGFWQNAMTSEEGFADMFSCYLTDPSYLTKYKEQHDLLNSWLSSSKSKLLSFIDSTIKKH